MTLGDISLLRLVNQRVVETNFKYPKEVVSWMGAMQAQDYNMCKWAVGVRLPESTDKMIEEAINNGEILRTHLLRPTWHLVSSDDISWMLDLTAPNIKATAKSRWKELELTEEVIKKSQIIIEKSLEGGKHLTREELMKELEQTKISTHDQRGAHMMLRAELDGLVCSGVVRGKEQTYALLRERVPKARKLSKEEGLIELASRYFISHGPATLQDFVWWSGLSVTDAKHGLEPIKSQLISEQIGNQVYWWKDSSVAYPVNSIFLLPAYDEFIISYRDRTPSLALESHSKTISNNGLFRPVMVENGQVTGIWKRTIKKEKVFIEFDFFQSKYGKKQTKSWKAAAEKFARFINKEIE